MLRVHHVVLFYLEAITMEITLRYGGCPRETRVLVAETGEEITNVKEIAISHYGQGCDLLTAVFYLINPPEAPEQSLPVSSGTELLSLERLLPLVP